MSNQIELLNGSVGQIEDIIENVDTKESATRSTLKTLWYVRINHFEKAIIGDINRDV